MQIISHRGASAGAPENTFLAFDHAIRQGVDALETDVLLTKDGQMVCRHDNLIQKDGTWYYLEELSAAELNKIDLGSGERVPSLEEVLERYGRKLPLLLDLKCPGLAVKLKSYFTQHKMPAHLHFTSFFLDEIRTLAEAFPEAGHSIVLSALPGRFQPLFEDSRTREVSLYRGYLTLDTVKKLQDHGICIRVYPVNVPKEAAKLDDWKIDGIFTDQPDVMQFLRKK